VIKARPEDFVVEERAELPLRGAGEFRVYRLTKSGWNTLDLVRRLARNCGVSPAAIAYGGKKDRHGLTSQYLTIRDARDFSREERNFRLEFFGFIDRPMGPDLIQANGFRIVLRDLPESGPIVRALEDVRRFGVPNFFDDQRFRSYDPERGFFAEKVLRRHYNGALQIYITSTTPEMDAAERERRRELFAKWRDWPACLALASGREEKAILGYLAAHPKEFARALHKLPQEEVSMRYSSFQSHLWNELLRRLIRALVPEAAAVAGAEGSYLFWRKLDKPAETALKDLSLPTAAAHMVFPDERTQALFEGILADGGLRRPDFRTHALRKVYFKSFLRRAVIHPENLEMGEEGPDELYPGRRRVELSFSLPRGSYATMVIKRLMLANSAESE
jgi:tRNA pseudouridine13 synthase